MTLISSLPGTELTDADLVKLSRGGDRDGFGRIVSRYQSLICALAYSSCGNITQSEDIAQEVFLSAWKQLDTLRDPNRLKECIRPPNRIGEAA
jgi:DNA-directed RNA polymerase specialized sigma24 family protein